MVHDRGGAGEAGAAQTRSAQLSATDAPLEITMNCCRLLRFEILWVIDSLSWKHSIICDIIFNSISSFTLLSATIVMFLVIVVLYSLFGDHCVEFQIQTSNSVLFCCSFVIT